MTLKNCIVVIALLCAYTARAQSNFVITPEKPKICKGSYANLGHLYQYGGYQTQVAKNTDKAIAAFEQEFNLYPEQKKSETYTSYLQLFSSLKKEGFHDFLQKEIETRIKSGLKSEEDFSFIAACYDLARLPHQIRTGNHRNSPFLF